MKALLLAMALAVVTGAIGFLVADRQSTPSPAPVGAPMTQPAPVQPEPSVATPEQEAAPTATATVRPAPDPMAAARSAPPTVYDPMAAARGAAATPTAVYDPMAAMRARLPTAPDTATGATDETFEGLPVSAGVEDTFYLCSACHSIDLVTQQRLTRQRWDHLLDWMVAEQGMPPMDDAQRETILSYLDRHFSP